MMRNYLRMKDDRFSLKKFILRLSVVKKENKNKRRILKMLYVGASFVLMRK